MSGYDLDGRIFAHPDTFGSGQHRQQIETRGGVTVPQIQPKYIFQTQILQKLVYWYLILSSFWNDAQSTLCKKY